MNENKWTPGPWEVDESNPNMVWTEAKNSDGSSQYICECPPQCTTDYDDTPEEEAEANAHLIVAAPELFEAIDAALTEYTLHGSLTDTARLLRAALAKAKRK